MIAMDGEFKLLFVNFYEGVEVCLVLLSSDRRSAICVGLGSEYVIFIVYH